jgi:hypothetical protein
VLVRVLGDVGVGRRPVDPFCVTVTVIVYRAPFARPQSVVVLVLVLVLVLVHVGVGRRPVVRGQR